MSLIGSSRRVLTSVALLAGFASAAAAQTAGTIEGVVFDKNGNVGLPGVTVVIPFTKLTAVTGNDGRFVITGVPAGQYQVAAQYTGYSTEVQRAVRVVSDSLARVSIGLAAAVTAEEKAEAETKAKAIRSLGVTAPEQQPMIIIDGVIQLGSSGTMDIPPADIESIEIVKGAAAAALYGERAKNGVILIKTKR
jgi:TonB-dependent SusC/RagA subfamily outer membrane receptor